ncbi:hypothetical protein BpHYR1_013995 [Brachionus plicatilis]|uniref:Secreted protein n=1 Tax=Brachionus plicatilis TaxID=10195 RepID=A0A3M7SSY9_BRAPC|nr:hypothetical protein BpHYR1_013995 [Brachionus plicatilis]
MTPSRAFFVAVYLWCSLNFNQTHSAVTSYCQTTCKTVTPGWTRTGLSSTKTSTRLSGAFCGTFVDNKAKIFI